LVIQQEGGIAAVQKKTSADLILRSEKRKMSGIVAPVHIDVHKKPRGLALSWQGASKGFKLRHSFRVSGGDTVRLELGANYDFATNATVPWAGVEVQVIRYEAWIPWCT
jgi:hypothetical protein